MLSCSVKEVSLYGRNHGGIRTADILGQSGGDYMIFDICLILFTVLFTSLGTLAAGAVLMHEKKEKKKKGDGWEGILNYDHKGRGDSE